MLITGPFIAQGPSVLLFLVALQVQTVEIRNVNLRTSDAVQLRVRDLRGEVVRSSPANPATLDDARSFRIKVTSGTIAMTGDDLGAFLNANVFAYPGSPIHDLHVELDSGALIQTGTIHKVIDIKFRMRADVSLTPDGRIRVHPTHMTDQKLLHTVGLNMSDLIDVKHARGLTIEKDDIIMDALSLLPPPAVEGRLADVRVDGNQLIERFVGDSVPAIDTTQGGYLHFRGGLLRFGRLSMSATDLLIESTESHGPFAVNLPRYNQQLVAGFSKTTPTGGLIAHLGRYVSPNAPH
jgi:hypothetical protein